MKAVNLIPGDARRAPGGLSRGPLGPGFIVLGLLTLGLVMITMYVLTGNTVASRQAELTQLQGQISQQQAAAARLASYVSFQKLAQARVQTVRQITAGRFDWHGALVDLSRVVPAGASLQSLTGTAAPGASVSGPGGAAGGSTSVLRAAIAAPAFEMKGCTKTQDDVARLMSRMRLINGVQRVSLADSIKQDSAQAGAGAGATSSSSQGSCAPREPSFDLVVFFQPLPGGALAGATPGSTTPASTTPLAGSTSTSTTPPAGSTPTTTPPAGSTATTATSQPVSTPSPATPTGASQRANAASAGSGR